jgi:hypothetical protein
MHIAPKHDVKMQLLLQHITALKNIVQTVSTDVYKKHVIEIVRGGGGGGGGCFFFKC